MAVKAVASHDVSIALACRTFQISESCYRYERKLSDENAEIAEWLVKLTDNRRTWGFGLCFLYLRNVKGFGWNHTHLACVDDQVRGFSGTVRMPLSKIIEHQNVGQG